MVRGDMVGRRAASVPWLSPAVTSLLALADEIPEDPALLGDPGLLLLQLRYGQGSDSCESFRFTPSELQAAILPEAVARYLEHAPTEGRLEHTHPVVRRLLQASQHLGTMAIAVARETELCPPAAAQAVASLVPMGWLLVATVSPDQAEAAQHAITQSHANPYAEQVRLWGLSHDAIIRRIALRWRLPAWVARPLGNLDLASGPAAELGAPAGLYEVVQATVLAYSAVRPEFGFIQQIRASDPHVMRLAEQHAQEMQDSPVACVPEPVAADQVIIRLMKAAARGRRRERTLQVESLHDDVDQLHAALRMAQSQFESKLQDAKLAALAELAAGAGHEINNPLAIISGNAQRMLGKTEDPDTRKALESILRQSRRIAEIVKGLMLYARPRPPVCEPFDLQTWLRNVVEECRPLAALKGIELLDPGQVPDVAITADNSQLGRALTELIRNGIDAASYEGIVRVSALASDQGIEVIVEDDGPGPDAHTVDHMFDPFFSGRAAGRGRGLGLPTAWRLARENGCEVAYSPTSGSSARFTLLLKPVQNGRGPSSHNSRACA